MAIQYAEPSSENASPQASAAVAGLLPLRPGVHAGRQPAVLGIAGGAGHFAGPVLSPRAAHCLGVRPVRALNMRAKAAGLA